MTLTPGVARRESPDPSTGPVGLSRARRCAVLLAALPISALLLLSVVDPARDAIRSLVERYTTGWSRNEPLDVLLFVAPAHLGAILMLLALGALVFDVFRSPHARAHGRQREHRRWPRLLARAAVWVSFTQVYGFLRLVDRTPYHFPWQIFAVLTLVCSLASVAWIRWARRATGWRWWARTLGAWATMIFPVACAIALRFDILCGLIERRCRERNEFGVNLAYTAAYGSLWLLILLTSRKPTQAPGPRTARNQGWAICTALVLTLAPSAAALPFWSSASAVRSHVIDLQNRSYETCSTRSERRDLWHAGAHKDNVCGVDGAWISTGQNLFFALVIAAALGLAVVNVQRRIRNPP